MPATGSVHGFRRASCLLAFIAMVLAGCREDTGLSTSPADDQLPADVEAQAIEPDRVAQGFFHSCLLTKDGRAYCWGTNSDGQLGNGTTTGSPIPVAVSGGLRFTQLSLGREHSCGVTTEQRVYCWGRNWDGQLGDGTGYPTNIRRLVPVPVSGNRVYRQVRAGYAFTCAVTTADAAFCWGINTFGQLGDGSTLRRPAPVRVLGGHHWRQLKAGGDHVCGVTLDDRAFCWGMGFWGQLGTGTEEPSARPARVAGGLLFREVTAGGKHSCGLTLNNQAYCWGDNNDGQIGDGTAWPPVLKRLKPVAVATDRRFDHLVTGHDHTCGIALNGRALCWGWNASGQIGDGSTTRRLTPVAVRGGLALRGLATIGDGNLALTEDGRLFRWGRGQTTPVLVPLQ